MPKLVDHRLRRHDIMQATWRLIARRGIDATTMREIAREAGFANGALTHYFRNKDDLLQASFEYVYQQTNERVDSALGGASGLAALRIFCLEVLPLDEARVLEARIVLPFWGRMAADPAFCEVNASAMRQWHGAIMRWTAQARTVGELKTTAGDVEVADELLAYLMGAQTLVVAEPPLITAQRQVAALDAHLERLTRP